MNSYFVKDLAEQHRRELLSASAARRDLKGEAPRRARSLASLATGFAEGCHSGAPLATWRRRAAITTSW